MFAHPTVSFLGVCLLGRSHFSTSRPRHVNQHQRFYFFNKLRSSYTKGGKMCLSDPELFNSRQSIVCFLRGPLWPRMSSTLSQFLCLLQIWCLGVLQMSASICSSADFTGVHYSNCVRFQQHTQKDGPWVITALFLSSALHSWMTKESIKKVINKKITMHPWLIWTKKKRKRTTA